MNTSFERFPQGRRPSSGHYHGCIALLGFLCAWTFGVSVWAAPFDKLFDFTQPDGTPIRLHGRGDEFCARFETLDGYTVIFDPAQRAHCFARQEADGGLVSTGVQVQRGDPATLGLAKGAQMSLEARRKMVAERYERWEQAMQIKARWSTLKAAARQYYAQQDGGTSEGPNGPQPSPPPFTTTGFKVGLTLLVDFSDVPGTIPQAEVQSYCNGDNYTGFGNNGSVKQYFYDNSNGLLTYTNVVTVYLRVPQPKTYYDDGTKDCGTQARLLINDAITAMKALPNYSTEILPTFDALTVDNNNQVSYCNVYYAGVVNSGWTWGLWPHSGGLGTPVDLGNGKKVNRYQITDIGSSLELGTFCHENGHMLCGYPDIYDYEYDSSGGAGMFCLMNSGGQGGNPVQICAYLKRASGWATVTQLTSASALTATVTAPQGPNFNHFYRFQKPGVPTEYYLVENRQPSGRDSLLPASGIAIWHVDELGDRDDQSLDYNTTHSNYEVTLVQADNQWHLQKNANAGDARDLYYAGNPASAYQNRFSDVTTPSARWWDGSASGVLFTNFSASGPDMTFVVGAGGGGPAIELTLHANYVFGGNGNGIIEFNECNGLSLVLTNVGATNLTGVRATLSTTTPGAAISQPASAYPDIPVAGSGINLVEFGISTSPTLPCGTPIDCVLSVKADQGVVTLAFRLATGQPAAPVRFDSTAFVPIPDGDPIGTNSTIVVSNFNSAVTKVTVGLYITHTYDEDLTIQLVSPDGVTNTLAAQRGGFGQNYGLACSPDSLRTTFDDDAAMPISVGVPSFVGSYRPEEPLAVYAGKAGTNVNGTWLLHVVDDTPSFAGVIQCWSLFFSGASCADGGGECSGADLALGMTAQPEPVTVGNNLIYDISVTNNGPSSATNVVVTHQLPQGMIFISATNSQGTWSQAGGIVTCSFGIVRAGNRATLRVVVLPVIAGTFPSTASAISAQTDPNPANSSATVVSRVNPVSADLAVGIAATPSPVIIGSTLTYTVSVTNNGPSTASGIDLTNVLPDGVAIVSTTVSPSQGAVTTVGQVVVWSGFVLASAERATATIRVIPTVENPITATASVAANQLDPIAANNTAAVTTTVTPAADLIISITDYKDPVVVTSNFTYTVIVTNLGPSVASAVTVNQTLPETVSVVSSNATQGAVSRAGNILTWNLGALVSGGRAILTVEVGTSITGILSTTASVTGGQTDPNPGNNTASATTVVSPKGVNIVDAGRELLSESGPVNGAIDIGETVTLALSLLNISNYQTFNLDATLAATDGVDPVPPNQTQHYHVLYPQAVEPVRRNFTFTASGTNGGKIRPTLLLQDGTNTYPPVEFVFDLPTCRSFPSADALIMIPDPDYSLQSGPAKPYPSVITVSNLSGVLGKVTVAVSNLTHSYPGDVNLLLVAPNGAKTLLMSHAGSMASANVNLAFDDSAVSNLPELGFLVSGVWRPTLYGTAPEFPAPAPGSPYTNSLAVLNAGNPNGTWSLYAYDDFNGDAGSISNGWSLGLTMLAPVNLPADLSVSGVATPGLILAGGSLTYTFTITNKGPNHASSVSFTNNLPPGVMLVNASTSPGAALLTSATSVHASFGTLNTGVVATVTVEVIPSASVIPPGNNSAFLTNIANVTAGEDDLEPVNNVAPVVTTVTRPVADVEVEGLVVAPDPAVIGISLTNRIVVANRGPETALNVVLTSTTRGACTNVAGTTTTNLNNLAPNQSATVTFVLPVANSSFCIGRLTNTVSVATDSQDTNTANNTTNCIVSVTNPAPRIVPGDAVLTYESGPVNGAVDSGETVTFELALRNVGYANTTTNFTATLQTAGGVTPRSGPQIYGQMGTNGQPVSKPFSFTAAGGNGGEVRATLKLQDGATPLDPPVDFTFALPVTAHFPSSAAIIIPDHGAATPYGSVITVANLTGVVSKVTVRLEEITHSFPSDVSVLLEGPAGGNTLVMSRAGGGYALTNLTLTFDDAETNDFLPYAGQITNKTYRPSSYFGPVTLPGPAPSGPYNASLVALNGWAPNGDWKLYVYDDAIGDSGFILCGWSLDLQTVIPLRDVVDLEVSLASAPASLFLGGAVTNTIWVTNHGPASATDVMVTNTLSSGQQAITNLSSLANGQAIPVSFVLTPSEGGEIVITASVGAKQVDLNTANNSDETKTTVIIPARATLSGSIVSNGFRLVVKAQPSFVYAIEASTNLSSWGSLIVTNASPSGTIRFTDTNFPSIQQCYYRTRCLNP